MRKSILEMALFLCLLISTGELTAQQKTVKFSGYDWVVKSGDQLGPGPNRWSPDNVWVDADGALHLKISQKDGNWYCAEVMTTKRLGFGTYQFQVIGRVDTLDKNIVLGLFNYPTKDVGTDGTNEIDIEMSRWGIPDAPMGNYTVWPAKPRHKQTSHTFNFALNGDYTTQRFSWHSRSILFQSLHGHRDDNQNEFGRWLFHPSVPTNFIPQKPLPVFINLWLVKGAAPSDSKEVEIIVKSFKFTPK